jgi:mRNA-degrading endonuclease RelE of RelBE toxin-antitoxin system
MGVAYRIEFDEAIAAHLRALTARERAMVFAASERQLLYEPLMQTRNRKQLRPNTIPSWELCVGDLRVFYEAVHDDDGRVVRVIAVGRKRRNAVIIGDKEYKREAEQEED